MPPFPMQARSILEIGVPAPRTAFQMPFGAPPPLHLRDAAQPADGHRRTRIWELAGYLHCSIIGTCFSTGELRGTLRKSGFVVEGVTDHDLHGQAVGLAAHHDRPAKMLNKALDLRHGLVIRQFEKAESEAELTALWVEARQRGDIPAGYWALLTHGLASDALIRRVFGEVHMLSHLVGAANRADIRRLSQLEEENAALREKLERQQLQHHDTIASREARILELNELLARKPPEDAPDPKMADSAGALQQLAGDLERCLGTETRRRAALEARLQSYQDELSAAQSRGTAAEEREAALRQEIEALEKAVASGEPAEAGGKPPAAGLHGLALLYVGGRPKQVWQARAAIEGLGGSFLHHDGGIDDNGALLAGLVSRADLAAFPVDCISHDAAGMVKRLCRQSAKPFLPLRSSGAGSLLAALDGPEIEALRRLRIEGTEGPRP
jgi:hypothetical protein